MTDPQWKQLLAVLRGETFTPPPAGFIIDCPWLPAWHGADIADYLSSETLWFEANRHALEAFPDVWFLPGFWSEFGMCTEPSACGCRCQFPENEFPFAEKAIQRLEDIDGLAAPNPGTDGLLPFIAGSEQLILTAFSTDFAGAGTLPIKQVADMAGRAQVQVLRYPV